MTPGKSAAGAAITGLAMAAAFAVPAPADAPTKVTVAEAKALVTITKDREVLRALQAGLQGSERGCNVVRGQPRAKPAWARAMHSARNGAMDLEKDFTRRKRLADALSGREPAYSTISEGASLRDASHELGTAFYGYGATALAIAHGYDRLAGLNCDIQRAYNNSLKFEDAAGKHYYRGLEALRSLVGPGF